MVAASQPTPTLACGTLIPYHKENIMKNNLRTISTSGLILAGTLAALALPSMAAPQGRDNHNARPERTQVVSHQRDNRIVASRFDGHRRFVREDVRVAPRDWRTPQLPFWVARRDN